MCQTCLRTIQEVLSNYYVSYSENQVRGSPGHGPKILSLRYRILAWRTRFISSNWLIRGGGGGNNVPKLRYTLPKTNQEKWGIVVEKMGLKKSYGALGGPCGARFSPMSGVWILASTWIVSPFFSYPILGIFASILGGFLDIQKHT